MVGRQPNAPAAFTPGEILGTHFQRLSRPQGTWFCRGYHGKKSPVTPPGIDPGTVRLVEQCLNHYATPDLDLYDMFCFRLCPLSSPSLSSTLHIYASLKSGSVDP